MDSFGSTCLAICIVQLVGWGLLFLWIKNETKR